MSSIRRRFYCLLSVGLLLICLTSQNGWFNGDKARLSNTAYAAQNPIQFQSSQNTQLQKLLQERYQVLRAAAGLLNQQYSEGKVGILEIRDAVIDMLHAEADLYSASSEKIRVYEKLVKILQQQDKSLAEAVNTGRISQMDFLRARAATLKAEIQLEKLKLSEGTPQ
jgi:hypothetical protein